MAGASSRIWEAPFLRTRKTFFTVLVPSVAIAGASLWLQDGAQEYPSYVTEVLEASEWAGVAGTGVGLTGYLVAWLFTFVAMARKGD